MAMSKFRVRGGLASDQQIKFNTVSNAGTASGSAVNNKAAAASQFLVLDTGSVAYRTAAELKSDLGIGLTINRGAGLDFGERTGSSGAYSDATSIGFSTTKETEIGLILPGTITAGGNNNAGGTDGSTGHTHAVTAVADSSGADDYGKLLKAGNAGQLTVAAFNASSGSFSGSLTVSGDLTVSGTTTTVTSENTTLTDAIMVLNKPASGNLSDDNRDSGLLMTGKPATGNSAIIFDANTKEFQLFRTDDDGTTTAFGAREVGTGDEAGQVYGKDYKDTAVRFNKLILEQGNLDSSGDYSVGLVSPGIVNVTSESESTAYDPGATGPFPGAAISTAGGIGAAKSIRTNSLIAAAGVISTSDATDATNTTTASLKTAGGLAVVKGSQLGGKVTLSDAGVAIQSAGHINVASTAAVTTSGTGANMIIADGTAGADQGAAMRIAGGLGVKKNAIIEQELIIMAGMGDTGADGGEAIRASGFINCISTASATSISTGSIKTAGGMGVAENLYVGGEINGGTGTQVKLNKTTDATVGSSAVAISSYPATTQVPLYVEGGSAFKGNVVCGSDLSVYKRLWFQDAGLSNLGGSNGTGTNQKGWIQPFTKTVAAAGATLPCVVIDKTTFKTAEVLIRGKDSAGGKWFAAKVLIVHDGGSTPTIAHTVYGEIFSGAVPADHAWDVVATDSAGTGAGNDYITLKYDHADTGATPYELSGMVIASN